MSYDFQSLHDFLTQTPEQGLRKMLVDQKTFTEAHLSLLLKVVRTGPAENMQKHFEAKDFPKTKLSPSETKIKEKFWGDLELTLKARGILQPAQPAKAA